MLLVSQVYQATQAYPKEEQYGLKDQMRRAAVSIPLNIAEGAGRHHTKEYIQFLYLSRGSAYEMITLIKLSQDLKYLTPGLSKALLSLLDEVTAMLNGLIQSLK